MTVLHLWLIYMIYGLIWCNVTSILIIMKIYIKKKQLFEFIDKGNVFMMTSSNGNIFRVTGPLCGEFTGPGEFPTQRPVTRRSFDVFFDVHLNKRLSKHSSGWWFETLSWSLWRHHNGFNSQQYVSCGDVCNLNVFHAMCSLVFLQIS